jgi:hypothetical protein
MSSVLGPKGQPLLQPGLDLHAPAGRRSAEVSGGQTGYLLAPDKDLAGPLYKFPIRSRLSDSVGGSANNGPVQLHGPDNPPAAASRVAARAASEPIPTVREMKANVALGGRAKSNSFLGLWSRSTPYKAVLTQVGLYHQALANMQRPPQAPDTHATRLADLKRQLGELRQSVSNYVDSNNTRLSRKEAMGGLLKRIDTEAATIDALIAELDPAPQASHEPGNVEAASDHSQLRPGEGNWPDGLTLQRGLDYARAGFSLRDMAWAHSLGIGPKTFASAIENKLPDEAIELIAKYPKSGDPKTVRNMLDQGFTLEHMKIVGALGLQLVELPHFPFAGDPIEFESVKAKLKRAEQLVSSLGGSAAQDQAFLYLERCRKLAIPDDFAFRCGELRLKWFETEALHKAKCPLDQIEEGVRLGLEGVSIAFASTEGLDPAQVGSLVGLGLSFDEIRAALRPPPDANALSSWQTRHPALNQGMQVLLAKGGVRADALTQNDILGLVALKASAGQIASVAANVPSEGELAPYLRIGAPPPLTRAEAMLLKASGVTVDAAARYRRHAEEADGRRLFVIPVKGPTTQTSVQSAQQVGNPSPLGKGNFNQVYTVRYQGAGEAQPTERIFKPVQAARSHQGASHVLGINQWLPRYEMRNIACSRIDSALGFGVVPRTEIGVVRQSRNRHEIGILMEKINGATGRFDVTRRVNVTNTDLGRKFAEMLKTRGPKAGKKHIKDYCRRHGNAKVEIQGGQFFLTRGKAAADVLPDDVQYQRQLVSLQLLDALVGQGDRHDRNWMRVASPDGKTARIVGIDNDQCLGARSDDIRDLRQGSPIDPDGALRGVGLPPVVDREQYEALVSMTPKRLRAITQELISRPEQDALLNRLRQIQNHLSDLRNRGKVIEPDRWGGDTLKTLCEKIESEDSGEWVPQSYLGRVVPRLDDGGLLRFPPKLEV